MRWPIGRANCHLRIGAANRVDGVTGRYTAYLISEAWLAKRAARLKLSKGRCSVPRCRTGSKVIHCHHLTYERVFNEDLADLLPLCSEHHQKAEILIKDGKIDRYGDVELLAAETLRLISPAKKAPKPAKRKPATKPLRAKLLSDARFTRMLTLRNRREFKIAVRKIFGGSSPVMGTACAIYDRSPKSTPNPGRYGPIDTYDIRRSCGARRLKGLYG